MDFLLWFFIQKVFEFFNFGVFIRKWIGLFYLKIILVVNQGGNLLGVFYVQCGCCEGDFLLLCLFWMCVEIFVIKLRKSNDFNGIKFLGREKKSFIFVDGILILMLDGSRKFLELSLGILRGFVEILGFYINFDEVNGIWVGSFKCCDFVLKLLNEVFKLGEKIFQLYGIEFDIVNL